MGCLSSQQQITSIMTQYHRKIISHFSTFHSSFFFFCIISDESVLIEYALSPHETQHFQFKLNQTPSMLRLIRFTA